MGLEVLQTFADTGTGRFFIYIVKLMEVVIQGGYQSKPLVLFVQKVVFY